MLKGVSIPIFMYCSVSAFLSVIRSKVFLALCYSVSVGIKICCLLIDFILFAVQVYIESFINLVN